MNTSGCSCGCTRQVFSPFLMVVVCAAGWLMMGGTLLGNPAHGERKRGTNDRVNEVDQSSTETDVSVVISFSSDPLGAKSMAQKLADAYEGTVHSVYHHVFSGAAMTVPKGQLASLLSHSFVRGGRVQPERTFQLYDNPSLRSYARSRAASSENISSNRAQTNDRNQPFSRIREQVQARDLDVQGDGVDVALMDGPIDTNHPDLASNVVQEQQFGDYSADQPSVERHGTHLAGVIAARDNRQGMTGIAPEANIHSLALFDERGRAPLRTVLDGLDWILTTNKEASNTRIEVINMGFGSRLLTSHGLFRQGVESVLDRGVTIVAAAGNDRAPTEHYVPADYPDVLTVSAVETTRKRFASFGNYGMSVDLLAPGVNVQSTVERGSYGQLSGTSVAAAMVTGGIANYLGARADAASPETVRRAVLQTSAQQRWMDYPGVDGNRQALIHVRNLVDRVDGAVSLAGKQVEVIDVYDGDTMKLRMPDGETEEIRLLGIDTPETYADNQPWEFEGVPNTEEGIECLKEWGEKATSYAKEQIANETVRIAFDEESDRRDDFDRLLGYLYIDGKLINHALIERGEARMYDTEFEKRPTFEEDERDAQHSGTGLWGACRR